MEPMLLKPVCKETLWGGNRLRKEFHKDFNIDVLGETWECSVHQHGSSIVANGEFRGQSLRKVLAEHPEYMGSKVPCGEELPILVKFIDANKDLSLQVHPADDYASKNEQQRGKFEMWYVVDALPGSTLVHGFTHDMSKKLLLEALHQGKVLDQLQQVEVNKGDVFYTPAGTIHGIGAGCLIAEIQENSDVTYRVYDYDRVDKNGNKRELHLDKALEVLNYATGVSLKQKPRLVHYYPGSSREILCRCKYFDTERIKVTKGMAFSVLETSFQVLLCLDGEAGIETSEYSKPLRFKKGDCVYLPAGLGRCFVIGECEFLKVRI